MSDARDTLFEWRDAGALPRERLLAALQIAGVAPSPSQWRVFAERLLFVLGAVLVAAAACYFIAANWSALGRYAKFALIEGAVIASLIVIWWRGVDAIGGRAALVAASLFVGVLLALVGQVYQTGADTYELFAAWAICILPWVLLGREPALPVVWLALIDIAIVLYFRTSVARGIGELDLLFTSRAALWWIVAVDSVALVVWEFLTARVGGWFAVRWPARVVATVVGAAVTWLFIWDVFGFGHEDRISGAAAYVAFAGAMFFAYRVRTRDLFMLAGLVTSGVVVVAFICGRWLIEHDAAGGFLLTGIVVVACAAAGSYWLRTVGAEIRSES